MRNWGTAVLIALAACSASSPTALEAAPLPRGAVAKAVARYSACLRDEGISVANPRFDVRGRVSSWPDYDVSTAGAAEKRCKKIISEVALPQMEDDPFYRSARRFIACLRRRDVPRKALPRLEAGALLVTDASQRDPAFRKAEPKCLPILEEGAP